MAGRGEALPGADPRALVPVSRRRPGGAVTGNRLSAYLLDLPVGAADPREPRSAASAVTSLLRRRMTR
ncbi:hypothetical protein DDE05_15900 [Streptomyces cavourensis]|nr:hypothetical protein DDE05_15900 [Streptomyces cavourensis]